MFEQAFTDFLYAFIVLFAIMDPFSSIPVYITLTERFSERQRAESINQAIFVAGVLILVFLFFGETLLKLLQVSLSSFTIAGGIILAVLGLQIVLGFSFVKQVQKDYGVVALVIATPLLTGPGVITTTIILSQQKGYLVTLLAAGVSLFLSWGLIKWSRQLEKLVGSHFIKMFSKIMGLLILALAIEFIRRGLLGA